MKVHKTKLFNGRLISLRDYEVDQAIKEGGCVITRGKQTMTITVPELVGKAFQCHGQKFRSKVSGWKNPITGDDTYQLVDFTWSPDEPDGNAQGKSES